MILLLAPVRIKNAPTLIRFDSIRFDLTLLLYPLLLPLFKPLQPRITQPSLMSRDNRP